MTRRPIRALIVDDLVRTRQGLRALLHTDPDIIVVGESTNGNEAVHLAETTMPDVVVMGIRLPELDGLVAARIIRTRWPSIQIVLLTMYPLYRADATAAGADVVVSKSEPPERLLTALRELCGLNRRGPMYPED